MGHVKRRKAVSELMGTLLMVGITLVAGFAIFGFVNGQAASSENQYGASVAQNVNYLRENFVIVSVQFPSTSCSNFNATTRFCNQATIAVYNNGAVDLTIKLISMVNLTTRGAQGTHLVPDMVLSASSHSTTATCGLTKPPPSGNVSSGYSASMSQPIKQQSVPPNVFTVNVPGSICSQGFLVGASYKVSVLGAYGNLISTQVTASG